MTVWTAPPGTVCPADFDHVRRGRRLIGFQAARVPLPAWLATLRRYRDPHDVGQDGPVLLLGRPGWATWVSTPDIMIAGPLGWWYASPPEATS